MFRKKKDLSKTPSVLKKGNVNAGNPGPHSPSLSSLQEQSTIDGVDGPLSTLPGPLDAVSMSCPGTPSVLHSKLVNCPSPVNTLRRPKTLSRHASAAGFPMQTAGAWAFSRGHSRGLAQSPTTETAEVGAAIEVEDIPALLRDVARFAEAVERLKDVVLGEDKDELRRGLAHECLGEVLRVLRQVIGTYPLLNTVETLTAAGTLISKVKGFHFEASNETEKKDFEKAIETIAVAFSSNVSELLMGEVDSSTLLSLPPAEKSRSMENLYGGFPGQGLDSPRNDQLECCISAEQVDVLLQRSEGGVDSALSYAKSIARYLKDVISYVDKRITHELDFARKMQSLYQSCKDSFTKPHMPLFSIYSLALEQDLEQSMGAQQATGNMHAHTFIQPLLQRKQEHEKKRREIKEQWQRAKRKLVEAENNLRKAKQAYVARCEEYDKARSVVNKVEEEQSGSATKGLDKKRRLEEEARNKAEEAEATYRTCIADASTHQQELEDVKVNVLRQIQDLIKQTDQTLRTCTIYYYQIMHMQTAALPVHYQTLCESCKLYDPGQQYAAHVKNLPLSQEPPSTYTFERYSDTSQGSTRVRSLSGSDSTPAAGESGSGDAVKQRRAGRDQSHKSWPSTLSDTDSVGGASGPGSPTTSTGDITKAQRPVSAGTLSSSEDLDEGDGNVASFERMNGMEPEIAVPTGPFRNVGLSKAAKTHRLRKLRTPSKCRECDSYVYFQGAECEECFVACHKKCLESLAIQCGHKKLQGRLQLFGRDFSSVLQGSSDSIPFIIKKCILEIEKRALKMKGIYRVNGVKTRVEKLCQAFENGKDLVELSQASPHDISNVLKLYLRQLPEPIMPFRMYNSLMGLAKESLQQAEGSEGGDAGKTSELVDRGPDTEPAVVALVEKLQALLQELPPANITTLRYITRHLQRVSELEQDNKMSPSNLGIVFGPTLMRPKPTGATVSLSSLVDYPHQARIVEALIVFHKQIFSQDSGGLRPPCPPSFLHSQSQNGGEERRQTKPQEGEEEQSRADPEQCCGNSLGSSGSRERSLDSDSELDEVVRRPRRRPPLASQESETSTEDDQLSPRVSLDLSGTVPETIPEQSPSHTETETAEAGPGTGVSESTDRTVEDCPQTEAELASAE
ncbi:rho GTPase-activating protein 45 isoform X1 [Alosa sapidissima]|uniref:rho GTPase-activating protein 45 isoform X1 n=1 Tax=Alosa sapidissima TaxID=34773 RepID=UPI001C08A096|nr:rho GTPase-activating protein 45 isoform X1 [Alosa sapidissima]XP_041948604.1 rho GTPase-activating protein 45 isoform X1 [Alosa sapidissima]